MTDSMELLNRLAVSNVLLDNRMNNLKVKISGKREAVSKLEDEIRKEQANLARIEEVLSEAKSKEGRTVKTIQGLRESQSMLANLKSILERGVRSAQEELNRAVSERNLILDKYMRTSEIYRTRYETLKTCRAISAKKVERNILKILIEKCRFDLQEYKSKLIRLKKISALRLKNVVINFAKLMVARKNTTLLHDHPRSDRMDFSEEMAALARSGVTLTVRKVPIKKDLQGFTSIKERLGVKSAFTSPYFWDEGGTKSFREDFTPQAASSQNPLEYNFPPGTSISIISPTVDDPTTIGNPSQKGSPFFLF